MATHGPTSERILGETVMRWLHGLSTTSMAKGFLQY
jgi:hypothetical protein